MLKDDVLLGCEQGYSLFSLRRAYELVSQTPIASPFNAVPNEVLIQVATSLSNDEEVKIFDRAKCKSAKLEREGHKPRCACEEVRIRCFLHRRY